MKVPVDDLDKLVWAASEDGRHAVAYELAWRTLADPSQRASVPVRRQLGDHLKSAVSYALHRDTRASGYDGFYTSGSVLRRGLLRV